MTNDDVPSVSVLLAVHNGEEYLSEALDSLLAQTFKDFELVVVDDASTDGTGAVLEAYAARDPRLVVVRNEENLRLASSLNRGLDRCRAPLVARADADDVYASERLSRQVRFMEAHPEVGVLGCGYHRVGPDGSRQGTVAPPADHAPIRARQLFMNSFLHPGVVFRTGVVRAVGGYDSAFWTAQDSDLWARLRDQTRFANLPEPLVSYRVHEASIVKTRGDAGQRLSLSVPQRLLSATLGRDLDADETWAVVTLYQGFEWMEAAEIRRSLPLLREVLDHVDKHEPPQAARFLKREAAASLLKQIPHLDRSDRPLTRTLLAAAIRLNPRLVLTRRGARRAARVLIPTL